MPAASDSAARLDALSREIPELAHTFSFMAGALHSLREARERGYRDRGDYGETDRSGHLDVLQAALAAVAGGSMPPPAWLAGFYYNAAIMRIDACYERLLKAVIVAENEKPQKSTGYPSKTDAWAHQVERLLGLDPPIARAHLEWARTQVNKLKHELYGRSPDPSLHRQFDLHNADAAVEEVIGLIERPDIKAALRRRFAGLPPA